MHLTQSLPRALVLLAIDSSTGALRNGSGLHYALIAAALVELVGSGRLRRDEQALTITNLSRNDDVTLDEVLTLLRLQPKSADLRVQMQRLAHDVSDLHLRILADLEREGIVRREQARVLGVYWPAHFPLVRPGVQIELRAQLRNAIRFAAAPSDSQVALIALMQACGLLGAVLSPQEIRQVCSRLVLLQPADPTTAWIIASADQLVRDSEALMLTVGMG